MTSLQFRPFVSASGPERPRARRNHSRGPLRRRAALRAPLERLEDRSCPSADSVTLLNPMPGDNFSAAHGINDAGDSGVYGSVGIPEHAVLWRNGVPVDLGPLGGTSGAIAYGLNNSDQVVGGASTPAGPLHAFLWQNGSMNDLGTLPGYSSSQAEAINSQGWVVGEAYNNDSNGFDRAFL